MKEWLQKGKELWKNGGKNRWAVFLLAGLLLLVISLPTEEKKTVPVVQTEAIEEGLSDRAKVLEEKLERILSRVNGVGKAKVLVTLKSDGKRLVEKDRSEQSANSDESSTTGGKQEKNSQEDTVYEKNSSGQEVPYISETMEPEVKGVLVVAEGGGNPVTVREITEAVQALFGIEVHKIKVMKMD